MVNHNNNRLRFGTIPQIIHPNPTQNITMYNNSESNRLTRLSLKSIPNKQKKKKKSLKKS